MNNHQLISLLKTFDRKEMTRFVAFAYSPYHHKHKDTQRLVDWANAHYPHFPDKHCERQAVWVWLFPDAPLDMGKLAVLFTYAWRLAEQFLVQETITAHAYTDIWLLQALRERRQWDAYERLLAKQEKTTESQPLRDSDYYKRIVALNAEANQYFTLREQRKDDPSLVRKAHALDQYYILEKLRDAVEMQVRRQILHGDYSARLLESVLEEVRRNPDAYADAPAIRVYFLLYQLMAAPSQVAFLHTMEVFQAHQHLFGPDEVAAIYNYLQNFCIARINANEPAFLRSLLELYHQQLERQLLHEDGYLIEWHYKNIVTTALRLGELDWANTFIEAQKSNLMPASAENAYRFSKAAWCHATGDYGSVLELLVRVEYRDMRYNLGAKALLLRTYYELRETDALDALVESFRQYLQRNRLMADSRRSGYYHLFRLTRRLSRLRDQSGYLPDEQFQLNLQKIKSDMEQAPSVFNRLWLEQKIAGVEIDNP